MFLTRGRRNAERRERRYDRRFEGGDERHDFPKAGELDDRIHDELSRPVVGGIAASLDRNDFDPACGQCAGVEQYVLTLRVAAERDDGFVFDDEPRVGLVSARDARVNVALQREDLGVGPASEVA